VGAEHGGHVGPGRAGGAPARRDVVFHIKGVGALGRAGFPHKSAVQYLRVTDHAVQLNPFQHHNLAPEQIIQFASLYFCMGAVSNAKLEIKFGLKDSRLTLLHQVLQL